MAARSSCTGPRLLAIASLELDSNPHPISPAPTSVVRRHGNAGLVAGRRGKSRSVGVRHLALDPASHAADVELRRDREHPPRLGPCLRRGKRRRRPRGYDARRSGPSDFSPLPQAVEHGAHPAAFLQVGQDFEPALNVALGSLDFAHQVVPGVRAFRARRPGPGASSPPEDLRAGAHARACIRCSVV